MNKSVESGDKSEVVNRLLRSIPPMDELLALPWVEGTTAEIGRETVKSLFEETIAEIRRQIREDRYNATIPVPGEIETKARALINERASVSLRPVINATGVVMHTNLGRSPLPGEAVEAVCAVAAGYSTLEYSLETGGRGQRNDHVEWLLTRLTGAESAAVVNNNAGAVLLVLAALASGREVIVSRGELVEIGGSFRIPDILSFSGAKMVAVGCTNCTWLSDYENAITGESAVILKVHPSNFKIDGFTHSVAREELAALARDRGLLFIEDMGSGLLADTTDWGLVGEPTVAECLDAGVDLVTFSGDKMLGGPQIGCVAGRGELISRVKRHQLLRALRVDKMTLAAFETILRMYLRGRAREIPTVAMLARTGEQLRAFAESLAEKIGRLFAEISLNSVEVAVAPADDAVGGGAFPVEALPGWAVTLRSRGGIRAERFAARLREAPLPVVAGIRDDSLVIHVRTLLDGDDDRVVETLRSVFSDGR